MIAVPIAAVFLAQYLQKKPDVAFLLSEQVPYIDGETKGTTDLGQRLEVKNVGDAEAKRITVKIEGQILTSSVKPFLAKDVVESSLTPGTVEHLYQSLPPGGSFQVVIKARSKIGASNVSVTHESGIGREALSSKESSSTVWSVFFAACGFLYLFVGLKEWRSARRYELLWSTQRASLEDLSKHRKPWFWTSNQWDEIRLTIAKELVQRPLRVYQNDFSESFSYVFLDNPGKLQFSPEATKQLTALATKSLISGWLQVVKQQWTTGDIEKVMAQRLPIELDVRELLDLKQEATKQWFEKFDRRYDAVGTLERVSEVARPEFIAESDWRDFASKLRDKLYTTLAGELNARFSNLVLDERALRVLTQDQASRLQQLQQRIKLQQNAESEAENLKKQMFEKELALDQLQSDLALEQSRVASSRTRVDAQLALIHEVLTDATAIHRIESHSEIFATGNLENLRRLAEISHSSSEK